LPGALLRRELDDPALLHSGIVHARAGSLRELRFISSKSSPSASDNVLLSLIYEWTRRQAEPPSSHKAAHAIVVSFIRDVNVARKLPDNVIGTRAGLTYDLAATEAPRHRQDRQRGRGLTGHDSLADGHHRGPVGRRAAGNLP
jgi:hypothetical protein